MAADVAQSVERILGKDEVTSSTLVIGSTFFSASNFKRGEFRCQETKYRWSVKFAAGAIILRLKTGGTSRAVWNTKSIVASVTSTRRIRKPAKLGQ